MNFSVAPPSYWNAQYEKRELVYEEQAVPFRDLFDRFMPRGGDSFEVGCYPGSFSIYLAKRFGYRIHGIDTTPFLSSLLPAHLRMQDAEYGQLVQGDFFDYEPTRKFDVVCSFGFVEHFTNYEEVIAKHLQLLADNGTLVISAPNFRNVQYLLHRWLDAENMRRHVLAAMDLAAWRRQLEAAGLSILWQGYYRTADFWWDSPTHSTRQAGMRRWTRRVLQAIDRRVDCPNRWLSPYMITFAKRTAL